MRKLRDREFKRFVPSGRAKTQAQAGGMYFGAESTGLSDGVSWEKAKGNG